MGGLPVVDGPYHPVPLIGSTQILSDNDIISGFCGERQIRYGSVAKAPLRFRLAAVRIRRQVPCAVRPVIVGCTVIVLPWQSAVIVCLFDLHGCSDRKLCGIHFCGCFQLFQFLWRQEIFFVVVQIGIRILYAFNEIFIPVVQRR